MKTDNQVAKGINEQSGKQCRSKVIDMRFYWIKDRINQGQYTLYWHPGCTNLADYYNKHFSPPHYLE
jgi:hypothetical protein